MKGAQILLTVLVVCVSGQSRASVGRNGGSCRNVYYNVSNLNQVFIKKENKNILEKGSVKIIMLIALSIACNIIPYLLTKLTYRTEIEPP